MKKRSFLLLEVLIALAIVALCAVPLMSQPIFFYRTQLQKLKNLELQRAADWSFFEIKELLLKNALSWEELPGKKDPACTLVLPDFSLQIPFSTYLISRSYSLSCQGEKEGMNEEIFRIYNVQIHLEKEKTYTYRLLVQKIKHPT